MKVVICIALLTITAFTSAEPKTISSIDYVYELG